MIKLAQTGFRVIYRVFSLLLNSSYFSGFNVCLGQLFGHPEWFSKNSKGKAQHEARGMVFYLFGQSQGLG